MTAKEHIPLPSSLELAKLSRQIYAPDAPVSGFDYFDAGMDDGICWAFKRVAGYDIVVFRGTHTLQDFVHDIRALAVPTRIGHVHVGFYAGMEHMWGDLRPMLTQPAVVTGHSLGAARAAVLTALMKADGVPPALRVVFGEPKPGLIDFTSRIADVPGFSYRNGNQLHHDLITDVPLTFPPIEYSRPTPIIPICAAPAPNDRYGPFAWHRIELYEAALAAAQPAASC
ncbi:lipase family protein [Bradyrhizobium sp. PMVTL-01]|uniref:lipase family protein n=1 Tax=Bradyrhizobium sp. PMVTL-01 TaxID=3434999 RepID=UPI003F6FBA15